MISQKFRAKVGVTPSVYGSEQMFYWNKRIYAGFTEIYSQLQPPFFPNILYQSLSVATLSSHLTPQLAVTWISD